MGQIVILVQGPDGHIRDRIYDCPLPPTTAVVVDQLRTSHGPGSLESQDGVTSFLATADQTLPWGTYRYVLSVLTGKLSRIF